MNTKASGAGRMVFAGVFLSIGSALNIIYGIAAIGQSHFFSQSAHYVFGDLKTWGWVTLVIGVLEGAAALSLFSGGTFGRWFGIAAATLASIAALLELPAYPLWSIAIFGLSIWILHGLILYGESDTEIRAASAASAAARAERRQEAHTGS